MRTTKSRSIALERAAELLPEGTVESPAHGRRRLTFRRAGGDRYVVDGSITRCLYVALFVATEPPGLGGLGIPFEEVRDRIRLRAEGVPAPDTKGVGAHERGLILACSLDGRRD